jgi:uncharacterized protein YbjQ (UPF0145 family)
MRRAAIVGRRPLAVGSRSAIVCFEFAMGLNMLISTTNDIPGRNITRHIGLVRGITVRSRSALGNFAGGIQSMFGGKLTVFVSLAETARQEALDHLVQHATEAGANAIIGMRYDANEIMEGITEVLAYGTAVVVDG